MGVNVGRSEASFGRERSETLPVAERKRRAQRVGRAAACGSFQQRHQRRIGWHLV